MIRLKSLGTVMDAFTKPDRLSYLTAVELLVLALRYGIGGVPNSQARTARCLHLRKTRVQDIERRALRKIFDRKCVRCGYVGQCTDVSIEPVEEKQEL